MTPSKTISDYNHLYHPFYCEENIWNLCQKSEFEASHVVFISSKNHCFPMLNQRSAPSPLTPVLWDYHVVLLLESDTNQIFDFDTVLPFSSNVEFYLKQSFIQKPTLSPEYTPQFRVIGSKEFVSSFASDRRHMKTDHGWSAPPPSWPAISEERSNLLDFTDMENEFIGNVFSYHGLLERFR